MPFHCLLTLFFFQISKEYDYYFDILDSDYHYDTIHIGYNDVKTVYSIFDQSEVIFKCPNKTIQGNSNISLVIYNQPTITFSDICIFDKITIMNKPKFHFEDAKVYVKDLVFLDGKFKTDFIYQNLITKQTKRQNKNTLFCNDGKIEILLSDYVNISCTNGNNDSFIRTIEYDSLFNYNIFIYTSIINISKSYNFYGLQSRLALISESLILQRKVKILFNDFLEVEDVSLMNNFFDSKMISLWIKYECRKYTYECNFCLFYSHSFIDYYKYLADYFKNITENSRWRAICDDGKSYLKYQDEELPHEIIVLNDFFTLTFFCSLTHSKMCEPKTQNWVSLGLLWV